MILQRQRGRRISNNVTIALVAALMGWLTLGLLNQSMAAEIGRGAHGYSWQNDVEIFIDGSRLVTMPRESRNEDRNREPAEEKSGPSICHQAGGTIWSTRDQKCPDSKPPERSQVWSTSPE